MNRNRKKKSNANAISQVSVQRHENLGDAGSSRKKIRHVRLFRFWQGKGKLVNDNTRLAGVKKFNMVRVAGIMLALGMLATLDKSTVATQAVMHADSRTLSAAMDISPDALAFVLNEVKVGE